MPRCFPMSKRVYNFSAGPAALPEEVLKEAQKDLLNFMDSGMSVMEMSHRSKEFESVLARAESSIRRLLNVPETHAILFLQGGASMQFSMVPINLKEQGKKVDFLQTGMWTQKAEKEIKKECEINMVASTESENFMRIPTPEEIKLDADASFVYMCSNNTIFGTQWKQFPETGSVPLVADMSSDILSRPIDVSKFGVIFAGAQKNLGPSGVTLVIIRKDLAERADKKLPTMLQYRTHIENTSLFNTPPTFGIYVLALVAEWVEKNGGLGAMHKRNVEKAKLLYDAIDSSDFYHSPVNKADRSDMNVVFRAGLNGGDEDIEKKFDKEATAAGLTNLKGHRSVGGLRASIYNAVPMEAVQALVDFMKKFEAENRK